MIITKPKKAQRARRLTRYPRLSPAEKDRYCAEILANCDLRGDCWVYRGSKTDDGYGLKKFGESLHSTSRFMLAYATRESLNTNDSACHKKGCLFKACCNPDHLYWGTHSVNSADREQAKRDHAELPAFLLTADPVLFLPILIAISERLMPKPMRVSKAVLNQFQGAWTSQHCP
jgi:hypothetical protein